MRGKAIHDEAGEIILKVLAYFEKEKENKCVLFPVDQVIKKTCAATGISPKSLLKLKKRSREYQESLASSSAQGTSATKPGGKLLPPRQPRKPRSRKIVLDHFELCTLKKIVDDFYTRKEVPTLSKVLTVAKGEINFQGGRTTLRNILYKDLGYKFTSYKKELIIPRGSEKLESNTESEDSNDSDYSEEKSMSDEEDQKAVFKKIKLTKDPLSATEDQKVFQTVYCKEEPMSTLEDQELFKEIKLEVE